MYHPDEILVSRLRATKFLQWAEELIPRITMNTYCYKIGENSPDDKPVLRRFTNGKYGYAANDYTKFAAQLVVITSLIEDSYLGQDQPDITTVGSEREIAFFRLYWRLGYVRT